MRRLRLVDLAALVVVALVAVDAVGGGSPSEPTSTVDPGSGSGRPATAALPIGSPVPPAGALEIPVPSSPLPSRAVDPAASTIPSPSGPGAGVPVLPAASRPGGQAGGATPTPAAIPKVTAIRSPTPIPTPVPTPAPTLVATPAAPPPPLSGCPMFPDSNVWNRRVDGLPVAADSAAMVAAIGLDRSLHPDFSNAGGYGIPYNVVGASTPRSTVSFQYDDESDHVGYPIPPNPLIEGGSDRHLLMVDTTECRLYELFAASLSGGTWQAGSGATWDLRSNALRPETWTSADAAGLPILAGLARHGEVASGEIRHALRFTAPRTCDGYLYPARHEAGSGSCASYPPMGLRVRLRADVDLSPYGPQARVVLVALQRFGAILADNGSAWYVTGAPSTGWDDDDLHDLHGIRGADFEVVDTTGFVNG